MEFLVKSLFSEYVIELTSRLSQVNRALLQEYPTLDPDADIVSLTEWELVVWKLIALGECTQLKAVTVDLLIKDRQLLDELFDTRLCKARPGLVAFLVLREDLELQEVLVSLEEREFLEKTLPGDLAMVPVFIEFPCNHGCLLELSQEDLFCLLSHVVR